jgi:hypothetical protein
MRVVNGCSFRLLLDMLQASPQRIDLQRLPTDLPF